MIANRDNAPKFKNQDRVNFSSTVTGAFEQTYQDMALTHDAFIPCTAAYDSVTKRHTLTPTQAGIVLPETFTVRFKAAASFTAGDKVYIGGKEYTPAYTDGAEPVKTGYWATGAEVTFSCATDKAYVGNGFGSQLEEKADKTAVLYNMDLESGYVASGPCVYTKCSNGLVVVNLVVKGTFTGAYTIVSTVPSGFRPSNNLYVPTTSDHAGGYKAAQAVINSVGEIKISAVSGPGEYSAQFAYFAFN